MAAIRFFILIFISFWINSQECNCNNLIFSNDSTHVIHYKINLDITNIAGKQLTGNTELKVTPRWNGMHQVVLDLFKLSPDSVLINTISTAYTYNDTILRINLPLIANPGDTLLIRVFYHGIPKVEAYGWGGFHFSGTTLAYNLGIALQDVPHNYGRVWFPGVDNFNDKSTYDFIIKVSNPLVAVCNGLLTEVIDNGDGTSTYHWTLDKPISAYLASVAVSNYVPVQGVYNGINANIPTSIYVKASDTTKARNSFIHLNSILATYENRFGPYRWPRVGYVSTPIGAMEHATNIAYPTASINGNLNDEYLYAHELSHMWFGDLVTCSSSADMWINEGWATFCESIYKEGIYGVDAYKNNMREKLHNVLQNTHIKDNGYRALYGIPEAYTYGNTVYEKGGTVTHSLRGYLGDSLFFSGVKSMLNHFAWGSMSSFEMRDFLSSETGVNLNDFYTSWVFEAGFPHFSVDSFSCNNSGTGVDVTVFVRQRLKGTSTFYNSNHLELGFLGSNWQYLKDSLIFSGQYGVKTFHIPFTPVSVMADPDERIADATTDVGQTIKTTGSKTFADTYCTLQVDQVLDSAFVRITHNWVKPDTFPQPIPGLKLSNYRYWTVEGILPPGFVSKARFYYSKFGNLDNGIITIQQDSVIILYRPSTHFMWQSIPFTQSGSAYQGELIVDTLKKGEYTIAVWNQTSGISDHQTEMKKLGVFPNPANGEITISTNLTAPAIVKIFNINGSQVDSIEIKPGFQLKNWNTSTKSSGNYLFKLVDLKGTIIATEKGLIAH